MSGFLLRFSIAAAVLMAPSTGTTAGAHDTISCNGCHSPHNAKTTRLILAVEPNSKDVNPRTRQPYGGSSAICLGCHQTSEKGGHGMTAVNGKSSHPYGLTYVDPAIAVVPPDLIKNGRFECSSCHDAHPSNTNRKYLLIQTSDATSMQRFCALCHPNKADPDAREGLQTRGANLQQTKPVENTIQKENNPSFPKRRTRP